MMWPMILDLSRDECKRMLRRLELEAYGGLVSALRAQGELSKEKRKLLQDLAAVLNISMERHRAEVRRAVNDEKLATVAEHIAGPNTSTDWAIEGRRLIPLMPRLVPQTAFIALANNVANIAAAENAKLPPPANTAKRNVSGDESPPCEPSIPEATKTPQRSASPSGGMMMLPSGMSIQVKREEDDERSLKRRRPSSIEAIGSGSTSGQTVSSQPPPKVPAISLQQQLHPQQPSRTMSFPMAMAPLKITLTSASNRSTVTTSTTTVTTTTTSTSTPTTQKVIIVQSPATAGPPSILQRSLSVPVVKTVSTTSSSTSPHPSNIVTISTNPGSGNNLTATTVSIGGVPTAAYITSQGGSAKIRPKAVQLPPKPRPRAGSIVIPMTPNQLVGASSLPGVQLKTALQAPMASVHTSSAGVKLLPVSSVNTTAKILPKPSFSTSSQSPVYVMSTTTSSLSVVTRTVPTTTGTRVMTVNTMPSTGPKSSPKPLQALHISAQSSNVSRPLGGKPNVIVVQKGSGAGFNRGITLSRSGKEVLGKMIMGKPSLSSLSTMTLQKPSGQQSLSMPMSSAQGNVIVLDLSQEQLNKNSVLAEILQASGILGDGISSSGTEKTEESSMEWADDKHCVFAESNDERVEAGESDQPLAMEDDMDIPGGTVVTLEEAVELLGDPNRSLLSTNSQHLSSQAIHRVMQQDNMSGGQEMMEVIGELDPQTGIYSIHSSLSATEPRRELTGSSVTIVPSSNTMDIFSTALASADINLDTFQYMEGGMDNPELSSLSGSNTEVTISSEQHCADVNKVVVESLPKQTAPMEEHFTSFLQPIPTSTSCDTTAVTVEPSHMDTTGMHIEDFTSQKVQGQDIT